jgi:UDP-2,3-diacylglucosamine hydrolase
VSPAPPVIELRPEERVWVTGDVHLAPDDDERVRFFLEFFAEARRSADRLVILGDLFDYWIGPRHARRCAYRPVVEAFTAAADEGYPLDFIAGNRDFLGPEELESIGLRVHGDLVVYVLPAGRVLVTHGDLLVAGDESYKRYRSVVRSGCFHVGYWLFPASWRLAVARLLRRSSERKLARVEPYAFPIDLARSQAWLEAHGAQELLMGHLHREEAHDHQGGRRTSMLPGWIDGQAPYFLLGSPSQLKVFGAPHTQPAGPGAPPDDAHSNE